MKIAVQFSGHLRTFSKASSSFLEHVVLANERAGFSVDIFMHTWDEFEARKSSWHNDNNPLKGLKVTHLDIEKVKDCYPNLKNIEVSPSIDGHGSKISQEKVKILRETYEVEQGIQYDWIIETRPDILFKNPLRIKKFIVTFDNEEFIRNNIKTDNVILCGHGIFQRMNIAHPNYVCEGDMIYFYKRESELDHAIKVPIDYLFKRDFEFVRALQAPQAPPWLRVKKLLLQVIAGFVPLKSIRKKIRQL